MKLEKLFFFAMVAALVLSLGVVVACGDDDDDDDDATDDDATDDDDTSVVEELLAQANAGCLEYWNACGVDNAEEICTAWTEAYRPAMETYADVIDQECMGDVMNNFFTCLGGDCDPTGAWVDCNAAVESEMLACFE